LALGVVAACVASVAIADDVSVRFWGTNVEPPSGIELDGHPCGTVVMLKTDVVPPDTPWMEADRVREVDAAGKIYRSWRVPVDQIPVGIEGDTLMLARGSEPTTFLTVDLQGRIRIPKEPPKRWLQPGGCPQSFADFGCVVIRREPVRYLVYPLVCT
jgi:hypothetical protein